MIHDIIVVGAGPAGLSFARDMAETGLSIVVLEKQPEKALSAPAYDGREIALTHLSHRILNDLDVWDRIPQARKSLIKKAHVLNGNSPYALSFHHEGTGKENLGFMVSNNAIKKAAYDSLGKYKNIQILTEKDVLKLGTDAQKGWVELADEKRLEARLIVAADSRFSATRRMMGIATTMLDFGRTCVVCTMDVELPHRQTAYECFHFGRTLAVLPLNDNQVSIVVTLRSEDSAELLAMSGDVFSADIERRVDRRFGAMKLTSKLFPYPLVATFAETFHAHKFALIGDAAVGMHPVTAHGFNLGLRGAHALANEIKSALRPGGDTGGDFASNTTLGRYSRKHRRICLPLYHGTNALVKLYTTETVPAKIARRGLLRLGNRIGPVKRLILNQLTEINAL